MKAGIHPESLIQPGVVDSFTTTHAYDAIHNMKQNTQVHVVKTLGLPGDGVGYPPATNHDFAYTYSPQKPHQATQIGDTAISYDKNGNQEMECRGATGCGANADHLRRFYWNEENRLAAVIDGGGAAVTRFVYDAAGERVAKLGRGGESLTIGQFFSLKGRKSAAKHVFAGTTRIATKIVPPPGWQPATAEVVAAAPGEPPSGSTLPGCQPSSYQPQKCDSYPGGDPVIIGPPTDKVRPATYYYHSDQLASTSWVTDQNGRVREHVEYFPYGQVWRDVRADSDGQNGLDQRFLFTGKELDEETGLYYFGARYYDPVRARWVSVDPILGVPGGRLDQHNGRTDRPEIESPVSADTGLSATLNRYSYVLNNPLKFVDPTGKWPTATHNAIIDRAFPGLSAQQGQALQRQSAFVDRVANQTQAGNHDHAMRSPGEDAAAARRAVDQRIQGVEAEARALQGSAPADAAGIQPEALTAWGQGNHTIMDRTSPAHTDGNGDPMEGSGIPVTPGEARDLQRHLAREENITPEQMNAAVGASRESFRRTFGNQSADAATGAR